MSPPTSATVTASASLIRIKGLGSQRLQQTLTCLTEFPSQNLFLTKGRSRAGPQAPQGGHDFALASSRLYSFLKGLNAPASLYPPRGTSVIISMHLAGIRKQPTKISLRYSQTHFQISMNTHFIQLHSIFFFLSHAFCKWLHWWVTLCHLRQGQYFILAKHLSGITIPFHFCHSPSIRRLWRFSRWVEIREQT